MKCENEKIPITLKQKDWFNIIEGSKKKRANSLQKLADEFNSMRTM